MNIEEGYYWVLVAHYKEPEIALFEDKYWWLIADDGGYLPEKDIDIIEEITNYYKINKIIINSNNISSKDLKSIENWWKY
jgi:hypothetical protein